MEHKTLYKTKWLHLMEMKDPENGVEGYIYTHSEWAQGEGVAVLGYRDANGEREYLLRQEITPCWSMDPSLSSVTGGMDKEGEAPIECAIRELEEEGGYFCEDIRKWTSLGTCRLSKASTTVMHLFAVDLTDCERGEAEGDGTELEAKAYCEWRTDPENAVDALVGTMVFKLGLK